MHSMKFLVIKTRRTLHNYGPFTISCSCNHGKAEVGLVHTHRIDTLSISDRTLRLEPEWASVDHLDSHAEIRSDTLPLHTFPRSQHVCNNIDHKGLQRENGCTQNIHAHSESLIKQKHTHTHTQKQGGRNSQPSCQCDRCLLWGGYTH